MKILHTSDWHIGHALYSKKRTDEHKAFLDWLTKLIDQRGIDALIVAGDVFDNGAPGGACQKLYFDFLTSIIKTDCSAVVIVAGNHDSPRFLQAPAALLKNLDIHVVGLPTDAADHVIELRDKHGHTRAICCAVPYLRKHEMVKIGEDGLTSDEMIIAATRAFYREVADAALAKRKQIGEQVPIIATGHLFAQGAKTHEGDGVRELYVGNLGHVGADVFPDEIDYTALGHIHGAQKVSGSRRIRYSGSPLVMSFSEIGKQKRVIEIDTDGMQIEEVAVPEFQKLARIFGSYDEIMKKLSDMAADDVWIEVTYTGDEILPSLSHDVGEAVGGGRAEVLSIRNDAAIRRILKADGDSQTLDTMAVGDVFMKCIDENAIDEKHRSELIESFNEILAAVEEGEQ